MSYLLLHNGNRLVKPWAAKFYNCTPMVCLVDPWKDASTLQQKYHLADKTLVCTDLTTADLFGAKELLNAKQNLTIIKVITSYESDLANLEPIWHAEYDQQQWLISTCSRLSFADQVVFLQPVALQCLQTEPAVVFTPGRSGTHILKNITGIDNHLHHNNNLLKGNDLSKILNAKKILSVLRKLFINQVISDAIARNYGVMLTTVENIKRNQQYVSTWKPLVLSDSDYMHTLEKICSYADLLMGLRMFYHKQIEFSLVEDLHEHFDKINYIKNPYRSQDIISNYTEAVEHCDREYQPFYNQLIDKLQCFFGIAVHHYE